jgi:hypothetical protein
MLGGCHFDGNVIAGDTDDGGVSIDASGPTIDADPIAPDAGVDAGVDAAPPPFGYTTSNFVPALPPVSAGVVLDCDATFDSASLTFDSWCGQPEPTTRIVTQVDGPDVVVVALDSFELVASNDLTLTGNRPVIFAVYGDATIAGDVRADASSLTSSVAGGLAAFCADGTGENGTEQNENGGGGGGGGFGANAGDGGDGQTSGNGGNGGGAFGAPTLIPLLGGCSGGQGGDGDSASQGIAGGAGGAVQFSVAGTLTISGRVSTSGGGARDGRSQDGGGGGGSGGGILLEANAISLSDAAAITSNGGGGGEGGSEATCNCDSGSEGSISTANPAAGGSGGSTSGGDGGDGGAGAISAEDGTDGQNNGGTNKGGGGGAGGAVGRIRLNAAVSCTIDGSAVVSPPATSNLATGCP